MQTAYDPVRIHRLTALTAASVDALSSLRSTDPAAQDAMIAIRLLRRNLEDLWMPLLRRIEASTAMTRWLSTTATAIDDGRRAILEWVDDHGLGVRGSDESFARLTDGDLLATLEMFDAEGVSYEDDLDTELWPALLPGLAGEIARRVRSDRAFARRVLELAPDHDIIGLAIGVAEFPPAFVRDVARAMLCHITPFDDLPAPSAVLSFRHVLAELANHPELSLDLLGDTRSLLQLVSWPALDPDTVAAVVTSGLHTAVSRDPTLLADGYSVVRQLTAFANGPLDGGFGPGAARGVAASMIGYIETFAPAIGKEDGGRVRVTTFGADAFAIDLGSYEEVRDLFGAIARDARAQATLGTVLGAYTTHVVEGLGATIDRRSGVHHVAQFADLLGDAVTAEQADMIAAAAATTAQRRLMTEGVGFAVGAALSATGAGAALSAGVARLVKLGGDRWSRVDADAMPNGSLRHTAHDALVVATVSLARSDRADRRAHGLDTDDAADLGRVDGYLARVAELVAAGDGEGYRAEVSDMVAFIRSRTPALDSYLTSVTDIPAVSELTEGHS